MKHLGVLLCLFFLAIHPLASSAAEKEWTMLVFLNGNNSLDSFGALNINQMEQVGSNENLNIVVQWASLDGGFNRRLLVQKDNDQNNVTSPVVQDLGKADMGDYRSLEDFLKWGITNYPAKHYFAVVWDHGSGWRAMSARARGGLHLSDISWDENTGHSITTKQLGQAINDVSAWLGRKIDIYGSDACLMGMVEIAGEMKGSVDYFVGSQDLEPGAGWPYDKFLAPFGSGRSLSPRQFATTLVEEYTKSYEGGSNGTADATLSAVDLSKYDHLVGTLGKLSTELRRLPAAKQSAIFKSAAISQAFAYRDYVDLADFLEHVKSQDIREMDSKVVKEASSALKDYVILSRNTDRFPNAHGVSIWIPKDTGTLGRYLSKYNELQFEISARWAEALNGFVGK